MLIKKSRSISTSSTAYYHHHCAVNWLGVIVSIMTQYQKVLTLGLNILGKKNIYKTRNIVYRHNEDKVSISLAREVDHLALPKVTY